MDYDFTDQEFTFFIKLHEMLAPYADEKAAAPDAPDGHRAQMGRILALLADTPYLQLGIDPVEGFSGLVTLMGAMETAAACSPSLALGVGHSAHLFGRIVSTWGNPAQKEKWLPPLLSGQLLGAVALSEENLNIDSAPLSTVGVESGPQVVVDGRKQYVVNAPIADAFAVAGVMGTAPVVFMIEKGTPGLSIGAPGRTMGHESATIAEVRLEGCAIPASQVIAGGELLSLIRLFENQILIGVSLGLMKSAFEAARDYAKSHKSGGKPIIAYQEVGFKLSEMLTLYQTSRLLAFRAAWTAQAHPRQAESLVHCAKVFCTESSESVAGDALRILGGAGYMAGNPVERAYRCAKYGQIAGTSTEIARVKIGDAALGLDA
jgi:alkylation response protein AidB-like acyl-CoA dehydrogenase